MSRDVYKEIGRSVGRGVAIITLALALDVVVDNTLMTIGQKIYGLPSGRPSQLSPESKNNYYGRLVDLTKTDLESGEIFAAEASVYFNPDYRLAVININGGMALAPVLLAPEDNKEVFADAIQHCPSPNAPVAVRVGWRKFDGHRAAYFVECGNPQGETYMVWVSSQNPPPDGPPSETPYYYYYNPPVTKA
jgi:hypothetical protein